MSAPESLSVTEIRKFMIDNGCKVTNHALVKHFKRFLTHPQTQIEARKEFKTYVNILATVKNENNQKYLILRKKYLNECPSEEAVQRAVAAAALNSVPNSPGGISIISDGSIASPLRQPPPYIPPPEVGTTPTSSKSQNTGPVKASGVGIEQEHAENYRECVTEFETAVLKIDAARKVKSEKAEPEPTVDDLNENVETRAKSISRQASTEDSLSNKENIPRFSFSSSASGTSVDSANVDKVSSSDADANENQISVKEATRKFNRMASEEEAKVMSPSSKKKPDKDFIEEKNEPEVTMAHPKAKEWIVAMAKASYQDLAKLAKEYPELVKLSDPFKGYTALHWAAKHGNEDVVKLIAGTYKADVNARTNGGYTPLHLAMQFGRVNIFELLCNTYKANRDLMDWNGNKPLDYSRQRTTVSDSTYSSEYFYIFYIYFLKLYNNEHFTGLFDMWSANGGGSGGGGKTFSGVSRNKKRAHLPYATISGNPITRTQSLLTTGTVTRRQKKVPTLSTFFAQDEGSILDNNSAATTKSSTKNNNTIAQSSESEMDNSTVSPLPQSNILKKEKKNTPRRKESFLLKTLRAATTSNKPSQDLNVTNKKLSE